MHNNLHSDWMLRQDELHKWKDEVDSHLVYDEIRELWYNNIDLDHVENIPNKIRGNFIDWDKTEQWEDPGYKSFCYECSQIKSTYKFGDGFFCMACIIKYIDSLHTHEIEDLLSKVPKFIKIAYNKHLNANSNTRSQKQRY